MVNVTGLAAGLAVVAGAATAKAQPAQMQILVSPNGLSNTVLVVGQDPNGQQTAGTAPIDLLEIDRAMAAGQRDAARANDAKKAETALGRLAWSVGDLGRETFGQVDADNVSDLNFTIQPVGNNPQILNNFYAADGSVLPGVIVLNANQASLNPNADGSIQVKMDRIYNPATTQQPVETAAVANVQAALENPSNIPSAVLEQVQPQLTEPQAQAQLLTRIDNTVAAPEAEAPQSAQVAQGNNSSYDPSEAEIYDAMQSINTTDLLGVFDREIAVFVKSKNGIFAMTPSTIEGRNTAQLFRVISHDSAALDREAAQTGKLDVNGNKTDTTIAMVDPALATVIMEEVKAGSAELLQATVRRVKDGNILQIRNLQPISPDQVDHAQRMQKEISGTLLAVNTDLPIEPLFRPSSAHPQIVQAMAGDALGVAMLDGWQNLPANSGGGFAVKRDRHDPVVATVLASALENSPMAATTAGTGLTPEESKMAALLPSGQFGAAGNTAPVETVVAPFAPEVPSQPLDPSEQIVNRQEIKIAAPEPVAATASEITVNDRNAPASEQGAGNENGNSWDAFLAKQPTINQPSITDNTATTLPASTVSEIVVPAEVTPTAPVAEPDAPAVAAATPIANEPANTTTATTSTGFSWRAMLGSNAATFVVTLAGVLTVLGLRKSVREQNMQNQIAMLRSEVGMLKNQIQGFPANTAGQHTDSEARPDSSVRSSGLPTAAAFGLAALTGALTAPQVLVPASANAGMVQTPHTAPMHQLEMPPALSTPPISAVQQSQSPYGTSIVTADGELTITGEKTGSDGVLYYLATRGQQRTV